MSNPGASHSVSASLRSANLAAISDVETESLARAASRDSELRKGDILMQLSEAIRETSLAFHSFSLLPGWAVVANDAASFIGHDLRDAGWVCFLMAGRIKQPAAASEASVAIRRAITKLAARATLQHCNALEIDEITHSRFLGMSRVSISAHVRHFQKGSLFHVG